MSINIYLVSNRDLPRACSLAASVYLKAESEVFFLDPLNFDEELQQLLLLSRRLPVNFVDTTGSEQLRAALVEMKLKVIFNACEMDLCTAPDISPGYCLAAADSPADCLQAAAAAIRLGYLFMALPRAAVDLSLSQGRFPMLWFGSTEKLYSVTGLTEPDHYTIINSSAALLKYFQGAGLENDYLVLYNSADLLGKSTGGDALGKLRVRGLSLLLTVLSSYRNIFPYDAVAEEPDPLTIERQLNDMVRNIGLKPRYLAVLASPAVIPFICGEKKAITAWAEEMVRDIHLRLNSDLFFDLAEGRLMQHTTGGLSTQLISTKYYNEIKSFSMRSGREVLIVSTPYIESGIIFSSDEALIKAQLLPGLAEAGYDVTLLQGREAHYGRVSAKLAGADYLLYTGHGGPEGLHTYGHSLNRADLPSLPPQVVYTSACSTTAVVPHWHSVTEGLEWQGIAVDSRQVIGLSFIEKGALVYIGGATVEDLQYSTSIYGIFIDALLYKGLSVGEALLATRDFISLYAATLLQKNPEAYRRYRWGTANALHQQVLLGDPAFVPISDPVGRLALPQETVSSPEGKIRLTVSVPPERWRRAGAEVNMKEASKHYYRCRNIEVDAPYGEDVISWGDYYRIAPAADGISDRALMSAFIHLTADLPPGTAPGKIRLTDVNALDSHCLLCGNKQVLPEDLLAAAANFKIPYLLQPPITLDMHNGWACSAEWRDDHYRLHWLAPLLLIDDRRGTATRLNKLVFEVETRAGVMYEGRISTVSDHSSFLIIAGKEQEQESGAEKGPKLLDPVISLTETDGSFAFVAAAGARAALDEPFPLYELPAVMRPLSDRLYDLASSSAGVIAPEPPEMVKVQGYLLDRSEGNALAGGLVRIFRGELDPVGDQLIEAFALELHTAEDGSFAFSLPPGKYLLGAAAVAKEKRYKSTEWPLELIAGEDYHRIYALDQAAVVKGRIKFRDDCPPEPPVIALKKFPPVEGKGALSKVPVDRDGFYECLVSFQDRFFIVLDEEGYNTIKDDNGGSGYKLAPQEVLTRDYILIRNKESGA